LSLFNSARSSSGIENPVDVTDISWYYQSMIARLHELNKLTGLLARHPVVGIIGARQVGKTTLARSLAESFKGQSVSYDLENPEDMARLHDPMLTLKKVRGLVVIDEIQRYPDLFPVLRVLADRPGRPARFLVLGSASPQLLRQGAETLAGRIAYHYLSGFSIDEVGPGKLERLWFRGGFPRSFLARSNAESDEWRREFIRTFLERDLPQLGISIRSASLRRFWTMLAHYHGQIWNASEFGRSFGVADTTIRHYLDVMTGALVVRQLQPWHANITKRQVKAPKVYLADSGLLHALLNLKSPGDVEGHPKLGASWEGFVIQQIIWHLDARPEECFFWATHSGAELDLLVVRGNKRFGFEIKLTSSPRPTPSMKSAIADLNLSKLDVIYAGDKTFQLDKTIRAVAVSRIIDDIKPIS
jgi:predicted AAA+ superfamily ATPase